MSLTVSEKSCARIAARAAVEVDEVGRVVALVVRAERVAADHEVGRALDRDRRSRSRGRRGASAPRPPRRVGAGGGEASRRRRGRRRRRRPRTCRASSKPSRRMPTRRPSGPRSRPSTYGVTRDADLARVEAVLARRAPRACGAQSAHRARHRPDVVDRQLDREDAGVGDEAVRRLVADAPAPRRRQPDRAALVAAEREVGLAGDERPPRCRSTTSRTGTRRRAGSSAAGRDSRSRRRRRSRTPGQRSCRRSRRPRRAGASRPWRPRAGRSPP